MPQGRVAANGVGETLHLLQQQRGGHLKNRPVMTPQQVDSYWQQPHNSGDETQVAQADSLPGLSVVRDEPLPDIKTHFFSRPENKTAWPDSQSALHRQLPGQPVQHAVLSRIYAEEGGLVQDPHGSAVGGITAGTLKELQEKDLLSGLPENAKPRDLVPDQQVQVYRAFLDHGFRNAGGAKALEQLDPDLAHAVADAMFMHGSSGGIKFVQQAIQRSGIDPEIEVDGGMGPQSFAALKKANGDPKLRDALQTAIVEQRLGSREWEPGEIDRISRARPGAWKR